MAIKGGTTSEETKAKQSAAAYRRWGVTEEDLRIRAATPKTPYVPKPVSEATRAKISRAMKGRQFSPETIERMREAAYSRFAREGRLAAPTVKKLKGFQKGNRHGKVNKGRVREITHEWRENSRLGTLRRKERDGYINSPEARAKTSAAMMGFKHSEESRRKMSESQKARGPRPPVPPEVGRKISASKMGKSNYKIKGANCHLWKGGITPENRRVRTSLEYKTWRRAVFERDDFTCQMCGTRGGPGNPVVLNADHILPFAEYPDLRLDLNNGRTLCEPCHKTTPSYLKWKGKKAA